MPNLKTKLFTCFSLLFSFFVFSQEKEQKIIGEIIFEGKVNKHAVTVLNKRSKELAICDPKGNFSIKAKKGDILIFYSPYVDKKYLFLKDKSLEKNIKVHLNARANELDEITIHGSKFSGDLEKDFDFFSKNKALEIDLNKNLADTKANQSSFSFSLDKIYALFSGKEKKQNRLSNYLEEENFVKESKDYYGENFFLLELKLSKEEIDAFLRYVFYFPSAKKFYRKKNFFSLKEFIKQKSLDYLDKKKALKNN